MFSQGDRPIPGYRLEKFLGRGQFGEVWSADGPGGTLVALKFIALHQKTGIRELKSIQAVKRIKHANLCSVNAMWLLGQDGGVLDDHEIDLLIKNQGRDDGGHTLVVEATQVMHSPQYLVVSMSLAEGSLDERLKQQGEGGIPRELLLDYMLQAARGIDYLNSPVHLVAGETVGIQHRDIKPANLLFAGDSVLVGDFGVAGAFGEYDTQATSVVGSLCYMSPESIKRMPSHSSDQYALAITYYQLRTGALPFEPTVSFAELVDIHVRGKLRFPLVSDYEREVLGKATSTDPKLRFGNCVEFVKALQSPAGAGSAPTSSFPLPALIGGAIAAVVLLAAVVWGIFALESNRTPDGPPLETHTLVFEPEQTVYNISITPETPRDDLETTGESSANLAILPTDTVHIVAWSNNELYQPLDRDYTIDELTRSGWKVTLPTTDSEAMLTKITGLAASGQWAEAKELFQTAAAIYPELKTNPVHQTTALGGTPALMTHSPSENRVATALSGDGNSLLGLLHLGDPTLDPPRVSLKSPPRQIHLPDASEWAVLIQDSVVSFVPLNGQGQLEEINLGLPGSDPQAALYPQITCSALSPGGKSILVGQDHQSVTLLTMGTASKPVAKQTSAKFPTRVEAVGFDPAGKFAFAMGQDGNGHLWPANDVRDETGIGFQVADLEDAIVAIAPLSESSLYAFTDTKVLRLTIPAGGGKVAAKEIESLRAPADRVRLSADGKFLVYSTEGQARPLSIIETASDTVTALARPEINGLVEDFDLSADSHWLVYADEAGALFTIDLTHPPFAPLELVPTQGQRMKFVRLSTDATDLVAVSESGTAFWWKFGQLVLAKQ